MKVLDYIKGTKKDYITMPVFLNHTNVVIVIEKLTDVTKMYLEECEDFISILPDKFKQINKEHYIVLRKEKWLHCKCGYKWNYKGNMTVWASCPNCKKNVKIK